MLAVLTGAYLAAVFLAGDSRRRRPARSSPRRSAGARSAPGVVTGAASLGTLLVVRSDARPLFDGLTSGAGLVAVLASGVAGVATLALIWTRRYGPARATAAAAVAAVTVGWALAQDPYVLPGELTLEQAAASDATLTALVVERAARLRRARAVALVPVPARAAGEAEPGVRAARPALPADRRRRRAEARMSRRDPLVIATLATGALGALLMILFEEWFTRLLGVLALFAFIVVGVFAIASPSFLEDDD